MSDSPPDTPAPKLQPLQATVLAAFHKHGPMTDQQLVKVTGITIQSASPRRRNLADMGYLEEVGTAATPTGKQAVVWGVVPDERIAEVREKNKNRPQRKKDPRTLPLETKLQIVRQLLDDPAVNAAAREQHGRAWSKVRGRVQDRQGQRERERRELKAQIREAERLGSPVVEFLKLKRFVVDATETIRAVDRFVAEDLERRNGQMGMHISLAHWPEVVDTLIDLAAVVETTLAAIRSTMGVLGDDVIESFAIDIDEIFELHEGQRH